LTDKTTDAVRDPLAPPRGSCTGTSAT